MTQNAPVLIPPKGIPAKRSNPGANDWVGPIQDDATNEQYSTQLKDLGSIAGGVESFNTRTGAVTLEASDVTPFAPPLGTGTATAVAGAATLNEPAGIVTSEGLTAATTYTLTLTNSFIKVGSVVLVNIHESTGAANPIVTSKAVTASTLTLAVSMAALTGTLIFDFAVFN